MKFNKIKDGKGFEMVLGTSHMIACCDCGLVHEMAADIEENGMLGLAFKRDEEETKKYRARNCEECCEEGIVRIQIHEDGDYREEPCPICQKVQETSHK